ncbi:uncharacterized protein LOC121248579 isoform X1 [Juglans microcarpa x Juglans regia]|uniref:uncharacterized protein LOC121248579 isoform X1 n=1 Tax=Juglans microcarpa x Juglans regia TaxID=2249226 RepID=UPI001B7DBB0B|nr:uncharacterized protein LOC121248579 isoform X1 [Juglans microcarpa x Juglans regia]
MASSAIFHSMCFISPRTPKCYKNQALRLTQSQFLSSEYFLKSKKQSLLSSIHLRTQKSRSSFAVFAAQSNFLKALQTVWKVGKDGIEAGTNLVPDSVPRPIARISVTVAALAATLFVLSSFLSTAFFVLATMGLVYFIFIAFNRDDGPRGGGGTTSTDDTTLEEARRIMEKYK